MTRQHLQSEGFRFVFQDGRWSWTHPALIKPDAIDGTDMNDEDFEAAVLATVPECAR